MMGYESEANSILNQVTQRFPAQADRIRALAASSEEFCALCEDYALAMATLQRLEASNDAKDHANLSEYRDVLTGLEQEIVSALAMTRNGKGRA